MPKLNLEEKNQTGLEGFEMFREEFGLEYVTEVEMDGAAMKVFLETRDRVELHIQLEGDERRTVLTFPLREPVKSN